MKREVVLFINFKIVSSLVHERKFHYVDGKRVDIAKYLWAQAQCESFDCFNTEIAGNIIRQYKTGRVQ